MARSSHERRRLDHYQTTNYKRSLSLIMFLAAVLIFATFTLLNPLFMKGQISKEGNSVVVERYVNERFDNFAQVIGAKRSGQTGNLLTVQEAQPMAEAMIDYTLGPHWFKTQSVDLAAQLRQLIYHKINDNSSDEAKSVKKQLKKFGQSGLYAIITGFGLANLTLLANIETLFWVVNIVVVTVALIAGYSMLERLKKLVLPRHLVNLIAGAVLWTSGAIILFFGLLAVLPIFFQVEALGTFGYYLEISSGVFLELVMLGAISFIAAAVIGQMTNPD